MVIAEPETRVFSDPFFGRQLRGISRELAAADTQLLLMFVEHPADYDRIGRYLSAGHVDGTLMFSLHRDDPLPAMAERAGLPTVYGGRPGWAGGGQGRGRCMSTPTTAGAPGRPYAISSAAAAAGSP